MKTDNKPVVNYPRGENYKSLFLFVREVYFTCITLKHKNFKHTFC